MSGVPGVLGSLVLGVGVEEPTISCSDIDKLPSFSTTPGTTSPFTFASVVVAIVNVILETVCLLKAIQTMGQRTSSTHGDATSQVYVTFASPSECPKHPLTQARSRHTASHHRHSFVAITSPHLSLVPELARYRHASRGSTRAISEIPRSIAPGVQSSARPPKIQRLTVHN